MESSDWLSDESFQAMARRLRQAATEELAEIEYETDRAEIKRQDQTTRALQAMMEGERWRVAVGSRRVEGIVVHPGENFVGLQDRSGNLHDIVHRAIATITIVSVDPPAGRAPTTFRPATFRARLLGLEQLREVELAGRTGSWALAGTIESVNADHLVLAEAGDQRTIVPIESIGSVTRTPDRHRRDTPPGRRDR